MGKHSSSFRKYYKCPKTRNEAKKNQEGWCRPKRRPAHLADAWDDRPRGYQKSWKKFRKTKYHIGGRGKKHTLFLKDKQAWELQEYCEAHSIPFSMETIREPYKTSRIPITKAVWVGKKPVYLTRYRKVYDFATKKYVRQSERYLAWYTNLYEHYIVGYRTVTYSHTIGYDCSWWYDKDIGVEYIIKR